MRKTKRKRRNAAIRAIVRVDYGVVSSCFRRTPELTHAGPEDAAREAELRAPSGVVCSDLVRLPSHTLCVIRVGRNAAITNPMTPAERKSTAASQRVAET